MARADRELERRRRRRRNRKWIGWMAAALVGTGLAGVVYLSPWLTVQRVEVVDALVYTDAATVVATADITIGTPIALVDAPKVMAAVGAIPAVRSVEVRRVWPDRILLAVVERTPVACVESAAGWQLVDRGGVVFGSPPARPPDCIVLRSAAMEPRREAARAAAGFPEWLRALVGEIRAGSADDLRFTLPDGAEVIWGSSARGTRKAAVLQVLLTQSARVYDVSAPDIPATRN